MTGVTDLRDNNWHHVAGVMNTVTNKSSLWVDGRKDGEITGSGNYNGYSTPAD